MNTPRILVSLQIVVAVFLLQGCLSTSVAELKDRLAKSQTCCSSFSEMKYQRVKLGSSEQFEFQGNQPVYNFEEGKSPFAAVEIPLEHEKREVIVVTKPRKHSIDKVGMINIYYFIPTILVLDNDYNVTRKIEMYDESFKDKAMRDSWVEKRFPLDKHEHYLVLHTDPKKFGTEFNFRNNYELTGNNYIRKRTEILKAKFEPGGEISVVNIDLEWEKRQMLKEQHK